MFPLVLEGGGGVQIDDLHDCMQELIRVVVVAVVVIGGEGQDLEEGAEDELVALLVYVCVVFAHPHHCRQEQDDLL